MHIATGLQGMESSRAAIKSSHDIHQPLGPPLGPQAESRELGRFVGSASWLAKHPGLIGTLSIQYDNPPDDSCCHLM